jgi:hypothetical protein
MAAKRLVAGLLAAALVSIPIYVTTPQIAQAQAVLTCATIALFNFDPVPAGTVAATRTETVSLNAGDTVTATWGGLTAFFWSVNGVAVPGATGAAGSTTYVASTAALFTFFKSVTGGPGFVRFTCTPAGGGSSSGATPSGMIGAAQNDQNRREPVRKDLLMDALLFFLGDVLSENEADVNRLDQEFGILAQYAPRPPSPPAAAAIEQLFYFRGNTALMSVPLQSPDPRWAFNVLLDGAIMDTSAAPARRTSIATATLTAFHRWDDQTAFGAGLKFGASGTTFTPATNTVNTAMFGGDLAVVHMLQPDLSVGLYGGYEINLHSSAIAGVNSSFPSHLFKAGANIEGVIRLDEFTLRPAASALLQFRHQPAFTDGAGVPMAAVNTLDLDAIAGVTAERTFVLTEHDLIVTPYLGLNLWGSASATTGAAIGYDSLRLQAVGGARFALGGGFNGSIQADLSRGASSTMLGLSGTISGPIN